MDETQEPMTAEEQIIGLAESIAHGARTGDAHPDMIARLADKIRLIAARASAPPPSVGREEIARIISNAPFPSPRSLAKADKIVAALQRGTEGAGG